jgi:hypothetical protein
MYLGSELLFIFQWEIPAWDWPPQGSSTLRGSYGWSLLTTNRRARKGTTFSILLRVLKDKPYNETSWATTSHLLAPPALQELITLRSAKLHVILSKNALQECFLGRQSFTSKKNILQYCFQLKGCQQSTPIYFKYITFRYVLSTYIFENIFIYGRKCTSKSGTKQFFSQISPLKKILNF